MRSGRIAATLALVLLLVACATSNRDHPPVRVLFVGNSLTYVGNLPAVFDALASRSGRLVRSEMLVKGGATLTQRLADGSFERALREGALDVIVLQERGGDFLCAFGPESCKQAENSLRELTSIAMRFQVKTLLLGSYQKSPRASQAIVDAESAAAARNSIPYIAVSFNFLRAMDEFPSGNWLFLDGMHPGHDLALLEATLLHQVLFDELPRGGELMVSAPMFPPNTRFPIEVVDGNHFDKANTNIEHSHFYSEQTVSSVLRLASQTPSPTPVRE